MTTTTPDLIRARAAAVLTSITPAMLSGNRFEESRYELGGNHRDWALANPTACLRRVSVREMPENESPAHSGQDAERRTVVLEVVVSYAQDHFYGDQGAISRDKVIRSDERQIIAAISAPGRSNFAAGSAYDAAPFFPRNTDTIERDEGVDFLVLEIPYDYYLERT